MSWQATAWAEKQVTGSPSRKVLLLVLSRYADEQGRCWPSQRTLATGCEQSIDTVQRNLKRLAADGFIKIETRQRFGGHWPSRVYQLNLLPDLATEPQNAARSSARTGKHRPLTEPQSAARPGRIEPDHRAAQLCGMNSNTNNHLNHHHVPDAARPPVEARQTAKRTRRQVQDLQQRVIERLGQGDKQAGWLIFGEMPAHERKHVESLEAQGGLTDQVVTHIARHYSGCLPGAASAVGTVGPGRDPRA